MSDETSWTAYCAAKDKQTAGDFAGAIADYQVALHTGGVGLYLDYARFFICLAYRAEGRLVEALAGYEFFAELLANPAPLQSLQYNFYYYRGCTFFAQGNIAAGKADHQQLRALLFRPDAAKDFSPETVHPRDLDLAIEDCSRADDYFCRGLAKKAKGDWGGAIADLKRAWEEHPENQAMRQWWLTAQLLQNGLPNPYFPQTLWPGIEYVTVGYNEPSEVIEIMKYAAGREMRYETYSRTEGEQLHERYKNGDEWVLMHFQYHQEGRSYYYWNLPNGDIGPP